MIGQIMDWFRNRLERRGDDEVDLKRQVAAEHDRLISTRKRADRVLADFHRADAVIQSGKQGNRWNT